MKPCTKCNQIKELSEFHKDSRAKDGLHQRCKSCKKATDTARYKANFEKARARARAWAKAHPEKHKASVRAWREANHDKVKTANRALYKANPNKVKAGVRAWQKANPGKVNALTAKRHAQKLQATPPWLSNSQLLEIQSIYMNCPKGHQVDHIIPLQGKNVKGLHVPWNLQYLLANDNLKKGNRL